MRNSWGSSWGLEGVFYVEIGKNSYCTEMEAMANIPFSESKNSLITENWFSNKSEFWLEKLYHVRRGYEGLDFDNGIFYAEPLDGNYLFVLCTASLIVAWIVI